ncbi:hypothetical protein [Bhargavaea beijingensis]|nr:hypothetical protein [Bhargavaea beijingensis]
MPTFKNGNNSLYDDKRGSGDPLILLHGLTMNHLHFQQGYGTASPALPI